MVLTMTAKELAEKLGCDAVEDFSLNPETEVTILPNGIVNAIEKGALIADVARLDTEEMATVLEGRNGTLLGSIEFHDTEDGTTHSRGWWNVLDTNGNFLRRIASDDDRELDGRVFTSGVAVSTDDVLALARTVFPGAQRIEDADLWLDDDTMGYVILGDSPAAKGGK